MYSEVGRPSIPPERLLKVSPLMALYTVRSERLLCMQLDYNLLFRWFLDMSWDEPVFDCSSFNRNRARCLSTGCVLRCGALLQIPAIIRLESRPESCRTSVTAVCGYRSNRPPRNSTRR